jgi:hypothetical protein
MGEWRFKPDRDFRTKLPGSFFWAGKRIAQFGTKEITRFLAALNHEDDDQAARQSRLDLFAAHALAGILSNGVTRAMDRSGKEITLEEMSWERAEKMEAERERRMRR